MLTVGRLNAALGLDKSEFNRGLDQARSQMAQTQQRFQRMGQNMSNVGRTMATRITAPILGIGAAVGGVISKTGDFADELLDLSDTTGIATERLQQFRTAEVKAGVEADVIAGSIERMNRQMTDANEYSNDVEGAAKRLEVATKDSNDEIRNATDVHYDLMIALSEVEDAEERARLGAEAFGRRWEDVAPVVGLGREELEKMAEADFIKREQLEAADEFRESMGLLKHELSMAFMEMGTNLIPVLQDDLVPIIKDSIIPAIENFAQRIVGLAEWFGNLSSPIQQTIISITGVLIAIGPLLMVLGPLVSAISGVIGIVGNLGGALTVLTGPVGIAIAVITALIGVGWYLYNNWESISEGLSNIWESVQESASSVWNGVLDTIKGVINSILSVINTFIDAINGVSINMPSVDLPFIGEVGGWDIGLNVPNIPMLAKGGNILQGGSAIVGEEGPEVLNLPKGAQVSPLDGGGGEVNHKFEPIVVKFVGDTGKLNDENIAQAVEQKIAEKIKKDNKRIPNRAQTVPK